MSGLSTERPRGALKHKIAPSRARASPLRNAVARQLDALAETLQHRAARAESGVLSCGGRPMESTRHSLATLEVSVTAPACDRLIIGLAVERRASAPKRLTLARR